MQSSQSDLAESRQQRSHTSVTVTTTARLHFGFLDPSGQNTRPFGSFGLSLDRPCTQLTLRHAEVSTASGPEADRAARYLRRVAGSCGIHRPYRLEIAEAIPSHAGLGSGTQLALTVGSAFAAVEAVDLKPIDIAARLGRGTRSGIGIATFEQGGAVLDSGPSLGALPQLVARVPFPEDWRVLLIFDPQVRGLDGAAEVAAFETLPAFPEGDRANLERRIAERALPALGRSDFATFCAEVGHLQKLMGAYFAPLQGGIYTSPRVAHVLEALRAEGVTGLGQSSWGPTGFAFAPTDTASKKLLNVARNLDISSALHFAIAKGRNRGAEIVLT